MSTRADVAIVHPHHVETRAMTRSGQTLVYASHTYHPPCHHHIAVRNDKQTYLHSKETTVGSTSSFFSTH